MFVIKFGKFDENEEEWPSNEGNSDGLPIKTFIFFFSVCRTKKNKEIRR